MPELVGGGRLIILDNGQHGLCHISMDCERCRIRFKCQTDEPVNWDEFRLRFKTRNYIIRSIVDEI